MYLECGNCGQRVTASHAGRDARGVQCPHCGATVPIFDHKTFVSPGAPSPEPVAPVPQLQIEGYEILGCLGQGGMGIVYLARQVSLDRKVAIKVMSPALLKEPSFIARFDREIAALVRLSHPHIVTIFDRGQSAAGDLYYVMEYVEGRDGGTPTDLERLIGDRSLDSEQVRALMLQIVQALGFAHREGIIHRDVKPSNILIDRHGFAKVTDFGIASLRASRTTPHVTVANQSLGTAIYMSPEQQRDAASVDHRTDIYATGVMLYQMLTGELPVAGYEPPSKVVPGLSPQWDAIVAKALQPRPENRFPDMQALEAALKSIGQTSAGQPTSPVPSPRTAAPPGIARGTSAGRTPTASQQGAVPDKADIIKSAEQLFVQGQWKKAAALMAKAATLFVGDEEITALMVQYREKANQVDEVLARMVALSHQNRWCEVSQVIAELQQSGVSVQGIEQYAAAAQQKLRALEPLVATARSLLQQGRPAQAIVQANRALQHVADHAEALEIVNAANKRLTRRRRLHRLVVGLVAVACLTAIAGGAYLYFTESALIDKARRHIASRKYEDALQTLANLPHRLFAAREVMYLMALIDLKTYASAKKIDDDTALETSIQRLKDLFTASEAWRAQAKLDLADVVNQVPSDAEDTLRRALTIARKLNELKVAEPAGLAEALLTKAKGRLEFRSPASEATPEDYATQILEWDPTKARTVVALALPKHGSFQQGLLAIQGWAKRTPSLAALLRPNVLEVAEPYVTTGRYEEAKPFVDTAKRIDTHFDTFGYWEKHFQKAAAKNWQAALQVLTFMVEGEENTVRLRKAAVLYNDLTQRYGNAEMTPPPEIREILRQMQDEKVADQFRQLIAEAERWVENRQYQDARRKLDEARSVSRDLWSKDEKAKELNEEVDFHLHVENARKCYKSGDFHAALAEVNAALQIRPQDKEALALRNEIQIAADKARVGQHRQKAASAVAEGKFRDAVDEILKAREILEKPSNAEWSPPIRRDMDELAKTLISKLHEQATELKDKRQYRQAEILVKLGQRLSPKDEKLSELLVSIKALQNDPKSANISGTWVDGNEQGEAIQMTLKDTGADTVAWRLFDPKKNQEITGVFKRAGAALECTRRDEINGVPGELTLKARIETPDIIVVYRREFKPRDSRVKTVVDTTKYTWTRQTTGETRTPDGSDDLPSDESGDRPARQEFRKTQVDDPFQSRSTPSPGPPRPSDSAPKPLPNGVLVNNNFSIAIVRLITYNGDAAEILLGCRRVGTQRGEYDWMQLSV